MSIGCRVHKDGGILLTNLNKREMLRAYPISRSKWSKLHWFLKTTLREVFEFSHIFYIELQFTLVTNEASRQTTSEMSLKTITNLKTRAFSTPPSRIVNSHSFPTATSNLLDFIGYTFPRQDVNPTEISPKILLGQSWERTNCTPDYSSCNHAVMQSCSNFDHRFPRKFGPGM